MRDSYRNGTPVNINGQTVYRNSVSFYNCGNGDVVNTFGTSTVYFDPNGKAVGLKDTYDFNSGDRPFIQEVKTQIGNFAGNGSEGYKITYGVTEK